MRLLLDPHAFLWWIQDTRERSQAARDAIAESDNQCFVSLASCWELAIKVSLGKLKLPEPIERFIPEQLAANPFRQLEIGFRHVARVAAEPFRLESYDASVGATKTKGRELPRPFEEIRTADANQPILPVSMNAMTSA